MVIHFPDGVNLIVWYKILWRCLNFHCWYCLFIAPRPRVE